MVADKLRSIYISLGWTHMTQEFGRTDDVVEELTTNVVESLIKDPKGSPSYATAGLKVEGYIDEEGLLNLDYNFNLI